jgi:hypothetical protein
MDDDLNFPARGYISIPVLPELIGRPYNALARGLLVAVRPSRVDVSTDGVVLTNSCPWRVTVVTDGPGGPITSVTQEVEVGLPDGVSHGYGFRAALQATAPERKPGAVEADPAAGIITVAQLRELIAHWPAEDRDGEPTDVWLVTGRNLSSPCVRAGPLNLRDLEGGGETAALILKSAVWDDAEAAR